MKKKDIFENQALAGIIKRASYSLFNAVRYVYAFTADDFYNINVKDLFKVSLLDVTNPDILSNLGVTCEGKVKELETSEFNRVSDMFFYAFAVRTPFLKRAENVELKDARLYALFELCVEMGAEDVDGIIGEDFKQTLRLSKTAAAEPTFNGEWFRRWVYTRGNGLAAITNRNMFLLGCTDALLPLYYAKLTELLTRQLTKPVDT